MDKLEKFIIFLCELSIPLPTLATRGFFSRATRTPRLRVILIKIERDFDRNFRYDRREGHIQVFYAFNQILL